MVINQQLVDIARKTAFDTAAHRLGDMPTDANVVTLVNEARTITAQFSDVIEQRSQPVACAAGCHFCCYLMATVSAPEALAIAEQLREMRPPQAFRQIKQAIDRAFQRTKKLDSHARTRAQIACPLLSEAGFCTIYEFRPLDCMTYHSLNVATCEAQMTEPAQEHPTNLDLRAIAIGIKTGLGQAIAGAGLENPALRYELIEALHIALNDRRALKKYLSGKNVFKSAAIITDSKTGIGHKIKYAPPHLKAEAQRVFDAEQRRRRDEWS